MGRLWNVFGNILEKNDHVKKQINTVKPLYKDFKRFYCVYLFLHIIKFVQSTLDIKKSDYLCLFLENNLACKILMILFLHDQGPAAVSQ